MLRHKELVNLPVETKAGQELGTVCDFEYDSDVNKIIRFHGKKGSLVSNLISHALIIHADQVISITKEKMVVEEAAVKEKKAVSEPASI